MVSGANGPGCTVVLTLTQSVSDCSVIEELSGFFTDLNVYANPSSKEFTIENKFNSESELYFYDSQAKLLFSNKYG